MGFGDEIISTGFARGAKARGKRIAFGDGERIIFSPWSEQVFRYNPNVARPGDETASDIEWIAHHKGNRLYNRLSPDRTRWIWNEAFTPPIGELYFSDEELAFADSVGSDFILIEPNLPNKSVAPNKDWGGWRYEAVAKSLADAGHRLVQFVYETARIRCSSAEPVRTPTFRHALAVMMRAALYIGPEGGLHHGAAADKRRARDGVLIAGGTPGVILFGGFIPPAVTGYPMHTNLTGGAKACGKLRRCIHCRKAMDAISVDKVLLSAQRHLQKVARG